MSYTMGFSVFPVSRRRRVTHINTNSFPSSHDFVLRVHELRRVRLRWRQNRRKHARHYDSDEWTHLKLSLHLLLLLRLALLHFCPLPRVVHVLELVSVGELLSLARLSGLCVLGCRRGRLAPLHVRRKSQRYNSSIDEAKRAAVLRQAKKTTARV